MRSAPPIATYRLQFTPQFGLDDATAIVPYLKSLGISHVYASPLLKARAGSTHGYDVIDPTAINPELGDEQAFARFTSALKQSDLGLILDFVPNHMGVNFADNPWWLDVLEWGDASAFAHMFDIDWDALPHRRTRGVLLPILGAPYGDVLESGELELKFDATDGSFSIWYHEHRLPVAPQRYGDILTTVANESQARGVEAHPHLIVLAKQFTAIRRSARDGLRELKNELAALADAHEVIRLGLDAYHAGRDRPAQTLALHHLLERQHYRVAYWRLSTTEINYRRFFDINNLAGLRVEDPGTFDVIHKFVAEAIAAGQIDGIRLDHIDGLRDPAQYFRRLHRLVQACRPDRKPLYVIIEKILGPAEQLPSFTDVAGTTGYEWLNVLSRLFVDDHGLPQLGQAWHAVAGEKTFPDIVRASKLRVMQALLASEFTVLVRLLSRIAAGHYSTRDYSTERLRQALELYVIHFPVYRTYVTAAGASAADRALIDATIERVRREWFGSDVDILDFLRNVLTLDLISGNRPHHSKSRVREFALKFQQFSGPMMAKSIEDTAFYRYHRLIGLNEVGGDADARSLPIAEFHRLMSERARKHPHGMTATSTHDTKRAEDARTRILAISELADEWAMSAERWRSLNAPLRTSVVIASEHEYLLYQTLIGAWPSEDVTPDFISRIQAFMIKAAREGKEQTSWLNPSEAYENALRVFVEMLLDERQSELFLREFSAFAQRTALIGALNSLTQVTLKATMPGVPDFYQGSEFWDLSLVDPDNRRPVDFLARRAALDENRVLDWSVLVADWPSGKIKLALTQHLLTMRSGNPELFADGEYVALDVTGPDAEHVIAFARRLHDRSVVTLALRHFAKLTEGGRRWPPFESLDATVDTANARLSGFTGDIRVGEALGPLPCAVITKSRNEKPSGI